MKQKLFKISIVGPTCPVIGDETTTFDTVWDSQKSWLAPGTKVLIEDNQENSKVYIKEKKHHG